MDLATQRMHRLLHKLRIQAEVEGVDESLSKPLSKEEKDVLAALMPGAEGGAEEEEEGERGDTRDVLDAVVEEKEDGDEEEDKERGEQKEQPAKEGAGGEEEGGEPDHGADEEARAAGEARQARDVRVDVDASAAPTNYSDAWLGRTAPTIGRSDNTWLLSSPMHRGIQRSMTHRMARLGTVLRAHSSESDAVFVTLPLPVVAQRPKAYMAWMEVRKAVPAPRARRLMLSLPLRLADAHEGHAAHSPASGQRRGRAHSLHVRPRACAARRQPACGAYLHRVHCGYHEATAGMHEALESMTSFAPGPAPRGPVGDSSTHTVSSCLRCIRSSKVRGNGSAARDFVPANTRERCLAVSDYSPGVAAKPSTGR